MYDLIIGKQTMHDLGVVLDFKESTIQIDEILLPFPKLRRRLGQSRALKASQFFSQSTPHHDGPPFDPMPASDANPQASAAAPHPGDATCVAARSDSADGGSTGAPAPFSAWGRNVTNGMTP
jgi:hypothetical protein